MKPSENGVSEFEKSPVEFYKNGVLWWATRRMMCPWNDRNEVAESMANSEYPYASDMKATGRVTITPLDGSDPTEDFGRWDPSFAVLTVKYRKLLVV